MKNNSPLLCQVVFLPQSEARDKRISRTYFNKYCAIWGEICILYTYHSRSKYFHLLIAPIEGFISLIG